MGAADRKAIEAAVIRPQPGPQEQFLASSADIAIYGGGAGGGKTYGLLIEAMRNIATRGFDAAIFRRESVQITNPGGLWDTAMGIYPLAGGEPKLSPKPCFLWPRSKITFAHLNADADVLNWQGAQVPMIGFDELTHFSRYQFFYMLSRNRSTCGVRPYVRATTNPDADSWVADFISWWIDPDSGMPIQARSGALRYFVRLGDVLQWGDSREELVSRYSVKPSDCKSLTFIPARVTDNRALLAADPGYLANLKALARVERERLLYGNWKVRPAAGMYFKRGEVRVIDALPADVVQWCRAWDLAATEPTEENADPDWTAGVKIGRTAGGRYVVADATRERYGAHRVRELIKRIASHDTADVRISIPEDPGQAGKDQAQSFVRMLAGYAVFPRRPSRDKITRAEPFAAQWQAGNVDVLRGAWNDAFFGELEAFPDGGHDDQVDAASDAFAAVASRVTLPAGVRAAAL